MSAKLLINDLILVSLFLENINILDSRRALSSFIRDKICVQVRLRAKNLGSSGYR